MMNLLKTFCGKNDPRQHLRTPKRDDDHAYATNGHIAFRVPLTDELREAIGTVDEHVEEWRALFARFSTPTVSAFEIPELPERKVCDQCNDTGKAEMCSECDGEGCFEKGSHEYDCKECDGNGQISTAESTGICQGCDGTGEGRYKAVWVGPAAFDRRYLTKIVDLPNVRIYPIDDKAAAYFRCDIGDGLLMPMRDDSRSQE